MTGTAQEWLARAKEDLATVEKLLDDEGLTNIAAFHAQQGKQWRETMGSGFQGGNNGVRLPRLEVDDHGVHSFVHQL